MVREDNGDIVEVPGAGEFGARGSLQNVMHIEEGDEGGQHASDVGNGDVERGNGERGVNDGEVANDGGLGVSAAQGQASRPDADHRG